MCRATAVVLALLHLAVATRADDTAPADNVIATVKKATVFIQVQTPTWKGSGSGFVTSVNKGTVFIATNYHVLAGPAANRKMQPTPSEVANIVKACSVNVVFNSGTKSEFSAQAEAIGADAENDLAILRVSGVNDPPTPIDYDTPPKLIETMPVFTFGYPFGRALAIGKGSPAITVGKASISSIRLNDNGELSIIQIDGALNPGNSGGPIVDAAGRLVGVAVATIKESSGIGLAIPAVELGHVMKGRLGGLHVATSKAADGKITVKAEVGVIDPAKVIRSVTLHYFAVATGDAKPGRTEKLATQKGVVKLPLKVDGGVASGEATLNAAASELFVQAVAEGGSELANSTTMRSFAVGGGKTQVVVEPGDKPPTGWKVFTPPDNAFTVWIPEKTSRQIESERTLMVLGQRLRISVTHVEVPLRRTYQVDFLVMPLSISHKANRKYLEHLFRNALVKESGGKVTDETDIKMGSITGSDNMIENGAKGVARLRVFVHEGRVFLLSVEAQSKEQVDDEAAQRFLNSFRLPTTPTGAEIGRPLPMPITDPVAPNSKVTKIQGGGNNPEFSDVAPEGGLLVGFHVGLEKVGNNNVVKTIRAAYQVGDKQSLGDQHGGDVDNIVKVIAKPGYAVGAITIKTGLGIDGISATFMKIDGARLNPKDAYESDWIGGTGGGGPVRLSGDGKQVVGLIGRWDRRDVNGLGLMFDRTVTRGKKTSVAGFGPDAEFMDIGPDGGILIGFEVGLAKSGNNEVVRAIRPVYKIGDTESFGEQRGQVKGKVVKEMAKPGYAIAALNVVTGLGIDGFSVTYMKISAGKLDPKDNYEGEYIGSNGDRPRVKVGGDGTPAIGLLGKTNRRNECTGIGLFLQLTGGAAGAKR